jgi:hypothetical protein
MPYVKIGKYYEKVIGSSNLRKIFKFKKPKKIKPRKAKKKFQYDYLTAQFKKVVG